MKLAHVIGTVVSTRKEETIEGLRLMLLQPTDGTGAHRARRSLPQTQSVRASVRRSCLRRVRPLVRPSSPTIARSMR